MYTLLAEHAGAITAYIGLTLAGSHILIPLLLITIVFAPKLRHPLLTNLCISSILTGILGALAFYAGAYDHPISRKLCLVQAAVIRSTNPLVTSAALMLVWHTWLSVRASVAEDKVYKPKRLALDPMYEITMLVFPYVLLLFFAVAGAATVIKEPEAVTLTRRIFYCSTSHGGYSMFAATVTLVIIAGTGIVEVLLGIALWRVLTKSSATALHLMAADAPFDLSFALRVFASGLYVLASCGFALTALLKRDSIESDVFAATVANFVAVAFGTRREVWRFWIQLPSKMLAIIWRSRQQKRGQEKLEDAQV
ncbi:hypothetical protein AURDEDRAFT_109836 [Auricularia subglabra TFB-10046 SS5]|nr:hypothetical protein AURDEDRAFT_109836 [Auricularia subglabra TFB-10046 SS5]